MHEAFCSLELENRCHFGEARFLGPLAYEQAGTLKPAPETGARAEGLNAD